MHIPKDHITPKPPVPGPEQTQSRCLSSCGGQGSSRLSLRRVQGTGTTLERIPFGMAHATARSETRGIKNSPGRERGKEAPTGNMGHPSSHTRPWHDPQLGHLRPCTAGETGPQSQPACSACPAPPAQPPQGKENTLPAWHCVPPRAGWLFVLLFLLSA